VTVKPLVKFATSLPYAGKVATPENVTRFALAAEEVGFDRVLIGEHLLYPRTVGTAFPYSGSGKMPIVETHKRLEMFTTFAYLAGVTTRLRFQSAIAILPLRSPVLTAKTVATLDYLSNGRVVLEVGVGWMREEFDALRVPFEQRGRILDEYIEIIQCLFAGGSRFDGEFLSIPDVHFAPRPVQDPFPIHIGSGLGDRALRRVAKYAHGWSPIGVTLEEINAKMSRLKGYFEEFGRSLSALEISLPIGGPKVFELTADNLIDQILFAVDAGITCVQLDFGLRNANDIDDAVAGLRWFGSDVVPHIP
jgi:probable F420-dependent oxidoreductase